MSKIDIISKNADLGLLTISSHLVISTQTAGQGSIGLQDAGAAQLSTIIELVIK